MIIHHNQVGFIPGMQEWFNICKSINVIYHINKMKDKNHMIISMDAKKSIWQNSTLIRNKNSQHSWYRGNISQHNKGPQLTSYTTVKSKVFPLQSGSRQGCPLSPFLFNIALEVLATALRQEKELKGIQIGMEEVKLLLFADMILYIENTKVSTKKNLLEQINEFTKVSGYKMNTEIYCFSIH